MDGTSFIHGRQPVLEALKGDRPLEKIWMQRGVRTDNLAEIFDLARERHVPVQYVPKEKLATLVHTGQHQGIVAAIARIAFYDYTEVVDELLAAGKQPLLVLLDGVTDVRNLGAIARTAYGMGADALILPERGTAPVNSEAVKASAGTLQHIAVCRAHHILDAVRYLQQSGISCVALDARGSHTAAEAGLSLPLGVVLGDEHRGVDSRVLKEVEHIVKLPMFTSLDSYNVSVAAAMLLYEVRR